MSRFSCENIGFYNIVEFLTEREESLSHPTMKTDIAIVTSTSPAAKKKTCSDLENSMKTVTSVGMYYN